MEATGGARGAGPSVRVAVRVDLLGPLRLSVDGVAVDVPGQRRRAVLALLALASGRAVSVDALLDAVWPDDPPESGHQALHSHVSRLRRHLGPAASRLRRVGAGYCLDLAEDELDVAQVRRLGRALAAQLRSEPAAAAATAGSMLAAWRGPALEEFGSVAPLAAEAVGLAELFRQTRDDALEARLAAGERGVTTDAAAAAREEPLRERTAMLLVRALALEGRTAEAMAAAVAYRRRLVVETGLDPGPVVAELEQQIATGSLGPAIQRPTADLDVAPTARRVARPAGPLVGRDQDLDELHRLLDAHRLVTVSGPGGVGKTRLALEIAADLSERGAEVVLVPLAQVSSGTPVTEVVVSALGLRFSGKTSPATVAEALADRALVLVLDNCEHLVSACRELVSAVQRLAPQVRVLVTSRVSLHLSAEYVVRLQPLPLPRDGTDLRALALQPSVKAFVEHAQRQHRAFALTAANAGAVVEVITRLDGLPLAIELAAGQLAALPVDALRDRLARVLDALSTQRSDDDARHRTLRATIDWSYRLLDPDDQALLRALAPFAAGADLATVELLAAETVSGTDPLVVLGRLVDASLVAPDPERAGRYTLLQTVRAFLLDDLDARGDRPRAEQRFLDWARRTATSIGADLNGPDEAGADRQLRAELANLRAARDLARTSGDIDVLVDLTLALEDASVWRDLHELWTWAIELAEDTGLAGHPQEVAVLGAGAESAWLVGDRDLAARLSRRGLDTAPGRAGADQTRLCWGAAAAVALFAGDFASARSDGLRGAALADQPAPFLAAAALAAGYAGDLDAADELLVETRTALDARPCPSHAAFADYVRGEVMAGTDPAAAAAAYTAAVETAHECGAGFVEGVATVGLASVWTTVGDVAAAAGGYRLLTDYWLRTGNSTQLWTTVRNAARLLADHGRPQEAALLLSAADNAVSAAALAGDDAVRVRQVQAMLADALGAEQLDRLRAEASTTGAEGIVRVARTALAGLARSPEHASRPSAVGAFRVGDDEPGQGRHGEPGAGG